MENDCDASRHTSAEREREMVAEEGHGYSSFISFVLIR